MANLKDLIVNGSARILGTIYGNVTGNVTGNVSGSAGSCTGNAATATKATQDASGNNIVNTYATKTEVGGKQATLVSGTNIKTINNNSILGSGNLTLDGLPSQSGNTGKYLTTNGSTASWTEVNVSSYHPNIFDIKWSDHIVNDVQWLRSDTFSWQDKDVYSTAYSKLVEEYNSASTTKIDYQTEVWAQPVFTSNTSHGTVSASSEYSTSYAAWKALDGTYSTASNIAWCSVAATTSGWWKVVFPYKLKITGLTYYSPHNATYCSKEMQFYTSEEMTTTIGNSFVGSATANTATIVPGIPSSGVITDTIYLKINSSNSTAIGMGELEIKAEKVLNQVTYKQSTNGFKIAAASQETNVLNKYQLDGIAWYYILDTTNKRFKLPRTKWGFKGLRDNVGDDIAESLPNITGVSSVGSGTGGLVSGAFYSDGTISGEAGGSGGSDDKVRFDASRCSKAYQNNAPVQERATQMYLYFYVGEYSRDAIEQTAGLNSELFNGKVDVSSLVNVYPVIQTRTVGDTSGYRIWAYDGIGYYCEQWGISTLVASTDNSTSIDLFKTFNSTNFNVSFSLNNVGCHTSCYVYPTAVNSLGLRRESNSNAGSLIVSWKASGYLEEGQV